MMWEAQFQGLIAAWTQRQLSQAIERLGGVKVRKGTRHWQGEGHGTKMINSRAVVDPDRWADDLVRQLEGLVQQIATQHAQRLARALKNGNVTALHPNEMTSLGNIVGNRFNQDALVQDVVSQFEPIIRNAAANQSVRLQKLVTDMDKNGSSVEDIQNAIRKQAYSRSGWHKQLAIAATTASIEGAKQGVAYAAGKNVTRTWVAHHDSHTRPTHIKADGQTVAGDKSFTVGGFLLRYPSDPLGPPQETCNCRCTIKVRPL